MVSGRSNEEQRSQALALLDRKVRIENANCRLPDVSSLWQHPPWSDVELQATKQSLDAVKTKLDDMDNREWDRLATQMDRASDVKFQIRRRFQVELGTVAWAKMFEILGTFNMLPDASDTAAAQQTAANPDVSTPSQTGAATSPPVFTVHLCEAPGAFICALNHWLKTNRAHWTWEWMATSLNPYYEGNDQFAMNDDDKLISATLDRWCWGADNSGDLREAANIRAVWAAARQHAERLGVEGASLVTADGGVDTSMDPIRQEEISTPLHYSELVAALGVLMPGGNLVYKAFTQFHHSSICLLHLMGCLFDEVHVFKPGTSKSANSELYVIGQGFRGATAGLLDALLLHCCRDKDPFASQSLIAKEQLPDDFLASVKEAARFFAKCTSDTITQALSCARHMQEQDKALLKDIKAWFAEEWVRRMGLTKLPRHLLLVPSQVLDGSSNNTSNVVQRRRELEGRLQDRREQYKQRREQHGLGAGFLGDAHQGHSAMTSSPYNQHAYGTPPKPHNSMRTVAAGTSPFPDHSLGTTPDPMNSPYITRPSTSWSRHKRVPSSSCFAEFGSHGSSFSTGGNLLGPSLDLGDHQPAVVDWSPFPDWQLLGSRQPLNNSDAAELVVTVQPAPPRVIKSKFIPDDAVLVGLRAVRQELQRMREASNLPPNGSLCMHRGMCVAPRSTPTRSRTHWKLAALDVATGWLASCMKGARANQGSEQADTSNMEQSSKHLLRALDLGLDWKGKRGTPSNAAYKTGVASYLQEQRPDAWDVVNVSTILPERRQAQTGLVTEAEPTLVPAMQSQVPHSTIASVVPKANLDQPAITTDFLMQHLTAETAQLVAMQAGNVAAVISDLSSLNRMITAFNACGETHSALEIEHNILYRRYLVWQIAVALQCVAEDGVFILRLADTLTMFSMGLMYILHRSFNHVCLLKPFASCSCSPERFLVCIGRLPDDGTAAKHVLAVLQRMKAVEMTAAASAGLSAIVNAPSEENSYQQEPDTLPPNSTSTAALHTEQQHEQPAITSPKPGIRLPNAISMASTVVPGPELGLTPHASPLLMVPATNTLLGAPTLSPPGLIASAVPAALSAAATTQQSTPRSAGMTLSKANADQQGGVQSTKLVVGEVVQAKAMLSGPRFYEYVASRTQALAQRELQHCHAALAKANSVLTSGNMQHASKEAGYAEDLVVGILDSDINDGLAASTHEHVYMGQYSLLSTADASENTDLSLQPPHPIITPVGYHENAGQELLARRYEADRVADIQQQAQEALQTGAAGSNPGPRMKPPAPYRPPSATRSTSHNRGSTTAATGSSPAYNRLLGSSPANPQLLGSSPPLHRHGRTSAGSKVIGSSLPHQHGMESRAAARGVYGTSPPPNRRETSGNSPYGSFHSRHSALGSSPAYSSFRRRDSYTNYGSPSYRSGSWTGHAPAQSSALGSSPPMGDGMAAAQQAWWHRRTDSRDSDTAANPPKAVGGNSDERSWVTRGNVPDPQSRGGIHDQQGSSSQFVADATATAADHDGWLSVKHKSGHQGRNRKPIASQPPQHESGIQQHLHSHHNYGNVRGSQHH